MEKPLYSENSIRDSKFLNPPKEAFRLQQAIIDTAEFAIISVLPDGIITSFNNAAEMLLGYSANELVGKSNALIFHDLEEVVKRAEELSRNLNTTVPPAFDVLTLQARHQKQPVRMEWILVHKEGKRFPAQLSITSLWDDQQQLIGYVILPLDLTERKKTEQTIEVGEEKFRLLAENVPGAIYLCHHDENYSVIYFNHRVKDITGYSAEDFLTGKRSFVRLFHPDDAPYIDKIVNEALQDRKSFQLKYRILHRSGDWRWVEDVGVGVYAGDQLIMIEGLITDITTQKIAEEAFQKIAEENHHVFNNPVNLNAIAGFDGYFKRVSPTWTRLLGWQEDELTSRPFIDFVHPEDIGATEHAQNYIKAGNNLFTFENRYRCSDNSYRWLLWGSASDSKNKLIYASAIDITERKKSEEQLLESKRSLESIAGKLQEQNRQLDEFAHIVSHNLRSPVGNINALINLLNASSSIDDFRLIFDKLKNVSKNISDTMNDLMDILKVRTDSNIDHTDLRFKEVLDKVIQSLEGDLIISEASITYNFNQAPSVLFPKPYLESIFLNLLSNAIKYRSPDRKPVIHFETKIIDGKTELHASDNGLGIDMERFGDKLFGLHKTFHMHREARGVGLFLIKTQLETLGGSIKAESRVDHGTTFIIRFNQ